MTHVYFDCSNRGRIVPDYHGVHVEDLVEGHQRAADFVRELVKRPWPRDWRAWTLRGSDRNGDALLLMPFACMVAQLH
jgi:hypothetical protein